MPNNRIKPDISVLKIVLSAIVGFIVFSALVETFTSEPSGGFKNSATPAIPENGYKLIVFAILVYSQLILHYYFTFKHWVIVNIVYYLSLLMLVFASLLVSLMAQI